MKRVGNLYEKICDQNNIITAIDLAAKHKHRRKNVIKVLANREQYAAEISAILASKAYVPSPYKTQTITDNPSAKERMIHIPRFCPDQVIHWALMIQIKPLIMRGMYAHTCGSVPGRGQSHGQRYLRRWLDSDHKGTKYCLKLDISKFYHNVSHDLLMAKFERIIKCPDTLNLIRLILGSVDGGLPIGNYTSQWFSNFFLQDMDHYIKQELGAKYYIRYVDDLVILGPNKKKLHEIRRQIDKHLSDNRLTMKGDWQVFPVRARPIDFLGFKFYREKTILRARNALRIRRRIAKAARKPAVSNKDACAIVSYLGLANRCDSIFYKNKYIHGIISIKKLKGVIRYESREQHLTTANNGRVA